MTDSTPAPAAEFERLAAAALDDLLERQPTFATSLGIHRFDDRLDDLRPAALNEERGVVSRRLAELTNLDVEALPVEHRVDAEILAVKLKLRLFELDESREHEWNPLLANPGTSLYLLLARDFAPLSDRLRSVGGRLSAVPEQLAAARGVLRDMPRVHVETAIDQFSGTLGMVDGEIPRLLDSEPSITADVEPYRSAASSALREHLNWLRAQVESAAGEPRIGAERFAAKLGLVLDAGLTPDDVLRRAEDDLAGVEAELAEVAADLGGAPRGVLDRLAAEAPDDDTVVATAKEALAEATHFVADTDLITLFDDPVDVIVMPEIHRGVAVAYCDPPGPFDPPDSRTFFAISPTPSDWPAERVESFYREYNMHMLRDLVVHEAMPGHVLQLAHGRRSRRPTDIRRAFWSGPFVEGWAVYAEELMARKGFGGPQVHVQQLKMRLRCAINAILDVRVHTRGMTRDEAMALMTGRGYQEDGEATGKWRRALLTSTQLSTYHVGFTQVRDVVAALRRVSPGLSERRLHDAVLAHGEPPPRYLPRLLGLS